MSDDLPGLWYGAMHVPGYGWVDLGSINLVRGGSARWSFEARGQNHELWPSWALHQNVTWREKRDLHAGSTTWVGQVLHPMYDAGSFDCVRIEVSTSPRARR